MKWLSIVYFDLRRSLSDRLAVVWMLLMPLAFSIAFGMAFQPRDSDSSAPFYVINEDDGWWSSILIELLDSGRYAAQRVESASHALDANWTSGVIIPATFSQEINRGLPSRLSLAYGDIQQDEILAAQAHLAKASMRLIQAMMAENALAHLGSDELEERIRAALNHPIGVMVNQVQHPQLRPTPTGTQLTLPGYLVMFVLQMTLIYGGVTLMEDRTEGQYRRLLASPLNPLAIFVAKICARILLAGGQAAILLTAGALLFGLPLGSDPLALGVALLSFAACIGAMSMLVGLICSNIAQVTSASIFLTMTLSPLGGCWWPIEIVPDWMLKVAQCLPTYWGLRSIQDVIHYQSSVVDIFPSLVILLGFTAMFLAAAVLLIRFGSIRLYS